MDIPRTFRRLPIVRHAFSLIEIVVAMAVLIIVMAVVVGVVFQVQQLTNDSRAQTEIYESARIFFDVVGQDLDAMVVSSEDNAPIVWTIDNASLVNSDMIMAFVSSSGIGTTNTDTDKTMEVAYSFEGNSIYRWKTTMADGSKWNFFNQNDASVWAGAASSWRDSDEVAANVRSVTFTPYDSSGTVYAADTTDSDAPAYIRVEVELYDRRGAAIGATEIDKTVRKFSKNFWIARGN